MRERRGNAESLGGSVEHRSQAGPALGILLFAQGPGLVFDNVFVHRGDESPGCFERTRKLELIEQNSEFANCLARRFRYRVISGSFRSGWRRVRYLALEVPVNHG